MTEKHQEIVELWLAGKANEDQIEWLWAESIHDADLLEYMRTTAGLKKMYDEQNEKILTMNQDDKQSENSLTKWYAAAATVLVLMASSFFFKMNNEYNQYGLKEIDLLELESPSTTRSDSGFISVSDSLLAMGTNEFMNGNKSKALEYFNQLIDSKPNTRYLIAALLNMSIINFNSGDFSKSIDKLNQLLELAEQESIIEKANWFKANALVNLKDLKAAQEVALKVYEMNGVFKKQAFLLIKSIDQDLKHHTFDQDYTIDETN